MNLNLRVLFLLGCCVLQTGCFLWLSDSASSGSSNSLLESHSNFIVDEVKGQVLVTRINGVPEEIKISYTACFRDAFQKDNPLPDSLFKIHLFEFLPQPAAQTAAEPAQPAPSEQPTQSAVSKPAQPAAKECAESASFVFSDQAQNSCLKLRTDAGGCVKWAEFYPYKAINQSVWFGYKRAFEGTGIFTGLTTVPMAVNPLLAVSPLSSALPLVDLRYYSEYKNQRFVELNPKDIPECSLCKKNNVKTGGACEMCEYTKGSLSTVVNYYSYKKDQRPRLWLNEVQVNISQELFPLTNPDEEQKKILRDFKVCAQSSSPAGKTPALANCKDPPGRFFKVQLELPLKIQVKDHRGVPKMLGLTYGDYSVSPYLFLQSNHGDHWALHRNVKFVSADLIQGADQTTLRADFYLHVPYERYGLTTLLGLKVRGEGAMRQSFLPFEGVFSFPNHLSSVIGRHNLKLDHKAIDFYKKNPAGVQLKAGRLVSFMDTYNLSMDPRENRGREGFRKAGWDIELRRFRFSDISLEEGQCPTPIGRHVRYVGEVCIIDPLTGKTIPNTSISIKRGEVAFDKSGRVVLGPITEINKTNISRTEDGTGGLNMSPFNIEGRRENLLGEQITHTPYSSDATGCLRWVDKLYHHWYDRERYFVRKMVFSIPELGFEGEKMIAINPWHWGFIFFQDITQLGPASVRVNPQAAERPRLVLHDFRNMFVNPVYAIDRLLGINIFQNLLFLFRAKIDRPGVVSTGFGGQRPSSMDIRRGYYWLRFILVKAHTEELAGQGNLAVKKEDFIADTYTKSSHHNWNDHIRGWVLNRKGQRTGQMMNTNLEYITHFDTYTQIRDTTVNAYINFIFDLDQFIFIGSNNRVIVQLLPTDPKYYVYHENTCQVDAQRSQFVPFTQHELIARPFMGTFVPGDRRNWNIFRILNQSTPPLLKEDALKNKTLQLNMQSTNQFIQNGQDKSLEHKLFLKLRSQLTVQTHYWPEKSLIAVKEGWPVFKKLYEDMGYFLSPSAEHVIDKEQLTNSVFEANRFLTTVLNAAPNDKTSQFFYDLSALLKKLLPSLLEASPSQPSLNRQVKDARQSIWSLINSRLLSPAPPAPVKTAAAPPTADEEKNWVYNSSAKSYKEVDSDSLSINNQGFELAAKSMPAQKRAAAVMNNFAHSEGLRVISLDNKQETSRFISSLNQLAQKYNTKYKALLSLSKEEGFSDQTAEDIIQFRQTGQGLKLSERDWWDESKKKKQIVWNNFPLSEQDTRADFIQKNRQMYLPSFSERWLSTVINGGIHAGTIDTPEVMTLLHSLCLFWFEKYYDEYLQPEQLAVLYDKHIEYYDYYRSTLEYLRKEGKTIPYNHLLEMMKNYDMENEPLTKDLSRFEEYAQNPFFIPSARTSKSLLHRIDDWWKGEPPVPPGSQPSQANVVQALYEYISSTKYSQTFASLPGPYGGAADSQSVHAQNQRHPFFKCMANPLNFFHTEKKIMVGDIGSGYEDITYEYGQTRSFNVQSSYDWAYSVNWSMARAASKTLGSGVSVLGGLGDLLPTKWVSAAFSFQGIRASADWSTQRSDSEGSRRQISTRFARALYLTMNHSVFSIRLKNFRQCLVVRPKNLAFEDYEEQHLVWKEQWANRFMHQMLFIKSGLLLCSEDISDKSLAKPQRILEDYFYIYQPFPGDQGQFQNPLNFRNRPYVITIRGVPDLEKLEFLFHSFVEADKTPGVEDYNPERPMTNPFFRESKVMDGMRRAFTQAKVWDKTGFYPGVYSVKYNDNNYYFKPPAYKSKGGFMESFGSWITEHNPMNFIPITKEEPAVINRPSR